MKQIDIYKKMTGEQRFMQAIRLSTLVRMLAITNIKNNYPHITQRKLINKYLERLSIKTYGRIRHSSQANKII